MGTLAKQLEKAKQLTPQQISNNLFDFLKSIQKEIVEINKKQVHEESKDIFDKALGFYSETTEYITTNNALLGKGNKIKKAGDPFDAEDTGEFLKGFYVQINNAEMKFGSKDPKTEIILNSEHWNSEELFGLSDKDLRELINTRLLPFVLNNIKKDLDV